jgi:predicted nucleic-acid-binding protein
MAAQTTKLSSKGQVVIPKSSVLPIAGNRVRNLSSKRTATRFCSSPNIEKSRPGWRISSAAQTTKGHARRLRRWTKLSRLRRSATNDRGRYQRDRAYCNKRRSPSDLARVEPAAEAGSGLRTENFLLEMEWVLRTAYRLKVSAILRAMQGFMDLTNWEFEDDVAVRTALEWFGQGMDFADALHLASAGRERPFATFDRALLRKASELGLQAVAVD